MMLAKDFEVGDLVWAKMKNFPPWPAQIENPPEDSKIRKGKHYVRFFGTEDFAWVSDELINHHSEHQLLSCKKKRSQSLQSAIKKIQDLSKDRPFKESQSEIIDALSLEDPSRDLMLHMPTSKIKVSRGKRLNTSESDSKCISSPKKQKGDSSPSNYLDNDVDPYAYDDDTFSPAGSILNPPTFPRGQVDRNSETSHVQPTSKRIGFIGLGFMGQGILKNLLESGHKVAIWNRTPDKCYDFVQAGAIKADTAADVVEASEIIFCCVSDPDATKAIIFGHEGVLKGLENAKAGEEDVYKGFVSLSSIDSETSQEIAEAITNKGGRYLEAPMIGSRQLADEGNLMILASGDNKLFKDCETCFHAISRFAYFINSEVGESTMYSLIISALLGTNVAVLAETLALADRLQVSQKDFLEILTSRGFISDDMLEKGRTIMENHYNISNIALKHQQKDLQLTLDLSNDKIQPLPLMVAANNIYKHARLLGYGDHDVSAVYFGVKY